MGVGGKRERERAGVIGRKSNKSSERNVVAYAIKTT
jgi:hypothetical protein